MPLPEFPFWLNAASDQSAQSLQALALLSLSHANHFTNHHFLQLLANSFAVFKLAL
jgi:hypothetical protein